MALVESLRRNWRKPVAFGGAALVFSGLVSCASTESKAPRPSKSPSSSSSCILPENFVPIGTLTTEIYRKELPDGKTVVTKINGADLRYADFSRKVFIQEGGFMAYNVPIMDGASSLREMSAYTDSPKIVAILKTTKDEGTKAVVYLKMRGKYGGLDIPIEGVSNVPASCRK